MDVSTTQLAAIKDAIFDKIKNKEGGEENVIA